MLTRSARFLVVLGVVSTTGLVGCGAPPPAAPARPCFTIRGDSELRAKDAKKTLDELVGHILLAPEDEALRNPKSLADVKAILRRDTVYLFPNAAAFARSLSSLDGRFSEATLELLMGESQLVASQVLTTQAAWVGGDMRIARANLASEGGVPTTDRGRMLGRRANVAPRRRISPPPRRVDRVRRRDRGRRGRGSVDAGAPLSEGHGAARAPAAA